MAPPIHQDMKDVEIGKGQMPGFEQSDRFVPSQPDSRLYVHSRLWTALFERFRSACSEN